ncbi:MAG TPA: DNA ligase D [Steroidobacteraceae bacterium]|jgi:bifunctional non-homologous end joining protein LigD|nr:DNA ligase D [Steroidobacteraceae bacterium]
MQKPALTVYRTKRDFTKTDEPSGEQRIASSARLRFVVQKHAARALHYDLRLEWEGVFKSWAVTKGPSLNPADKRLAVEVEDHPLDYGDFEGTIPKGEYGGGTVMLWDRGFWSPEGTKTTEEAFEAGDLKFTLDGEKLKGSFVLVRMRGDRFGGKRTNWLLIKHRDTNASTVNGALLEEDRSVASGRTMPQIAEGKGRRPKPFMLATETPGKADAVWTAQSAEERRAEERRAEERPGSAAPARNSKQAAKKFSETAKSARPVRVKPVMVKALPRFIEPQLAKLVDRPPDRAGWGHEVKFDGYRAQLRVARGEPVIRTRRGLDWTERFSAIAKQSAGLPDCIIDGEIVALDSKQLPSFGALQAALSAEKSDALVFYVFDLLFEGREDLRALPLSERKARLEKLLSTQRAGRQIRYVTHLESNAEAVLASACKIGLEGIVSKKLDAAYASGRSDRWVKAKCRAGQEVVLGGWTTESGSVRSLLAGVHRGGQLVYVGRIGTGYGREVAKMLLPRLTKLTREKSPFQGPTAPPKEANVRWLKPDLLAEIEFEGWTDSGMIRQAAFKGLREDKDPNDVIAETPAMQKAVQEASAPRKSQSASNARSAARNSKAAVAAAGPNTVMGVTISKPDKALWPDAGDGKPVTKLDLAHYYQQVGEWMLPHLVGRPCSLVRAPDGIGGQQFFQRHAMAGMSELFSFVTVRGDKAPYVQIDRVEALAAVAQFGALELHPWNCSRDDPESAGRLVFDLDPAPDVKFEAVIAAAFDIRERLEKVGLATFCKTTGGKGLHVVTPLIEGKKAVAWPVAKNFAHLICAQMAQDSPTRYLDNMSKAKRSGKIFLDYLRNDRTATAVAVLSARAREGATVSMPLSWPQVKQGLDPRAFTVRSAPALLKRARPWKGYAEGARSLADAIKHITR